MWHDFFNFQVKISQRKRGERYLELLEESKKQETSDTVGCLVMEVCSLFLPLTQRMAISSLLRAVEETGWSNRVAEDCARFLGLEHGVKTALDASVLDMENALCEVYSQNDAAIYEGQLKRSPNSCKTLYSKICSEWKSRWILCLQSPFLMSGNLQCISFIHRPILDLDIAQKPQAKSKSLRKQTRNSFKFILFTFFTFVETRTNRFG